MGKSAAARAEARFKQLCCLGLGGEAVMPSLIRELHDIVPSYGSSFFFADENLKLKNSYADFAVARHESLYYGHFHARRERELAGTFPDAIRTEFGVRDLDEICAFAGIDTATFHRSEHHNLCNRPQGLHTQLRLYVHREGHGRGLGSLTLHRSLSEGDWTQDEKRRIAALEPFLAHAVASGSNTDASLVDSGERGLIIADASGKPIQFSAEGRRLLFLAAFPRVAPGTDFKRQDVLPAPVVRICRSLQRIFSGDATAPAPTYHVRNVWGRFTFRACWLDGIGPDTDAIGITVSREEPMPIRMVRRIGELALSRRQAEVCLYLANGESNEVIAERLGISKHTAIAHGRWIYDKLDVHNRAELVNKLLTG